MKGHEISKLHAGELLVEVPESCLMSCRSARQCPVLGPILRSGEARSSALSDVEVMTVSLVNSSLSLQNTGRMKDPTQNHAVIPSPSSS